MSASLAMFQIILPCVIKKRPKWYLASCPMLDVHSQGETIQKAKNNLREALILFFESCIKRGTLDQVLKECGITPYTGTQEFVYNKSEQISVPIPIATQRATRVACHA